MPQPASVAAGVVGMTIFLAVLVTLYASSGGVPQPVEKRKRTTVRQRSHHQVASPPTAAVYVLRPTRIRPPLPFAAPLPVGRTVRLTRLNSAGASDDLRLSVWVYEHTGRGLSGSPDRIHAWPAGAPPLLVPVVGAGAVIGRICVNFVGTLRDTDLEIAILGGPNGTTAVWQDVIRRGTRWLYEITFGVPDEWQPRAQWDASRFLSIIPTNDCDEVVDTWVPLRPGWAPGSMPAGGGFAAQVSPGAPVFVVHEPQRAVRLRPGAWLALDVPVGGVTACTGFVVFRSSEGESRPVLAFKAGAESVPRLSVYVDRDGGLTVRALDTEVVRHTAGPVSGCVVIGFTCPNVGTPTLSVSSVTTGDVAVRTYPVTVRTGAAPLSLFVGAAGPTALPATVLAPRVLDIHELLYFDRTMDESLLRAVHQDLMAKWA